VKFENNLADVMSARLFLVNARGGYQHRFSIFNMFFVLFFENNISTHLRSMPLVFGLAGVIKLVLSFLLLNSFLHNIILLSIISTTILTVFISGYFKVVLKE